MIQAIVSALILSADIGTSLPPNYSLGQYAQLSEHEHGQLREFLRSHLERADSVFQRVLPPSSSTFAVPPVRSGLSYSERRALRKQLRNDTGSSVPSIGKKRASDRFPAAPRSFIGIGGSAKPRLSRKTKRSRP